MYCSEGGGTENDTDIGSLRALLLARGDHVANYTDLETDQVTDKKLELLKISETEDISSSETDISALIRSSRQTINSCSTELFRLRTPGQRKSKTEVSYNGYEIF